MTSPRTRMDLYVRPYEQNKPQVRNSSPLPLSKPYWKADSETSRTIWLSAMVHSQSWLSLRPDALTNIRPVPLPPNSITDRLKFLEDHIIQLERDFPPWAALHLNQPNREVAVGISYLPTQFLTSLSFSGRHPRNKHRSSSRLAC
jgi:hypothetical protein